MAKNYSPLPDAIAMYKQTEAMKDVKDTLKNLMNDDYERELPVIAERERSSRRRKYCVNVLAFSVCLLTACLLVLTIISQIQISRLRLQIDDLTANLIAVNVKFDSMNIKLANAEKFANEFGTLDDTIFTDDESNISIEDAKDSAKDKSLHTLQSVTVLEDEDDLEDDDENYDDDIAESGFYADYDRRRENKIGTSNMVHLKPEDFVESQLTFTKDNNIKEIKRIINENPENPDLARLAAHATEPTTEKRDKRSIFPESIVADIDQLTVPVVEAKSEERRKSKKYMPIENDSTRMEKQVTPRISTVSRMARNSDDVDNRRPFIAAHFHGNTSHLSPGIHQNYEGNGLVRVEHDAHHDVWYPSPWTLASPHPRPTLTKNGHVHVHHTGVYLVYVQIYYLDSHDIISWVLHRTNADIEGRETLLQCAQSAHSPVPQDKPNSCFSASALFLKEGDRLAVRNTGGDRHSLMQPEKSFIGLIKLADAEDPEQEF